MKLHDYKGYEFHQPTSGGKAGKGCNRTSTIQIRQGNCIVKQFRFELDIFMDRIRAVKKAEKWVDAKTPHPPRSALAEFFHRTLVARGHSPDGAEGMAVAFLDFDIRRHCGKPDVNDATDCENVEAFVEGVIYATRHHGAPK